MQAECDRINLKFNFVVLAISDKVVRAKILLFMRFDKPNSRYVRYSKYSFYCTP
jgi:hypothetical protein